MMVLPGADAQEQSTSNSTASTSLSVEVEAPKKKSAKRPDTKEKNGLRKCFSALVDRKQASLELEVLQLMIRKELNINLDALEPELARILPYMLVYYTKNWPGWQKSVEYYSGKIQFKTWYEKFHMYLKVKLNEAITTNFRVVMAEMKREEVEKKIAETRKGYVLEKLADRSSQTDMLAPKVVAPFIIEVGSKPVFLNTIVFTDNADGDIVLKQHKALEWDQELEETITLKQLIAWPHIGVHLKSPIFSFSRRNLHEFRRHVSLIGTPLPSASSPFIEDKKIIDPHKSRSAYPLDDLKQFTTDYLDALKNVYSTPAILESFKIVIDEFLDDIKELNILRNGKPIIVSNTSVVFNIGNQSYIRNKKLSKTQASRWDVGYTELIIPKIDVALVSLAEDERINAYLKYLKTFKAENGNTTGQLSFPQINFSCSFCRENYDNVAQVLTHLKQEHKMEQPMLCGLCKKSFPVFMLSASRWHHECCR
ncbi:unnamed protein product [Ceutorhynchus assimilis]|uniref:C2H2-type domain-containing protein n=1 Tax=Ceutorhynchus assimilis TaxID=467358 RepID=A0A9N9MQC9_9CUCU|nr:unnamed protein product [Ceutorhynchus assimilis]